MTQTLGAVLIVMLVICYFVTAITKVNPAIGELVLHAGTSQTIKVNDRELYSL